MYQSYLTTTIELGIYMLAITPLRPPGGGGVIFLKLKNREDFPGGRFENIYFYPKYIPLDSTKPVSVDEHLVQIDVAVGV